MIRPQVEDTVSALRSAVISAGLAPDQLTAVLLVGLLTARRAARLRAAQQAGRGGRRSQERHREGRGAVTVAPACRVVARRPGRRRGGHAAPGVTVAELLRPGTPRHRLPEYPPPPVGGPGAPYAGPYSDGPYNDGPYGAEHAGGARLASGPLWATDGGRPSARRPRPPACARACHAQEAEIDQRHHRQPELRERRRPSVMAIRVGVRRRPPRPWRWRCSAAAERIGVNAHQGADAAAGLRRRLGEVRLGGSGGSGGDDQPGRQRPQPLRPPRSRLRPPPRRSRRKHPSRPRSQAHRRRRSPRPRAATPGTRAATPAGTRAATPDPAVSRAAARATPTRPALLARRRGRPGGQRRAGAGAVDSAVDWAGVDPGCRVERCRIERRRFRLRKEAPLCCGWGRWLSPWSWWPCSWRTGTSGGRSC